MARNIDRGRLHDYAEKVAQRLCDDFFEKGRLIKGQEILKFSEMEQCNLLILKNLYLKWNEETRALKSPYFDYEAEEVRTAMKEFLNVLSRHISVGREALIPIVSESIEEMVILASNFKLYMRCYVTDRNSSADLIEGTSKFYKMHGREFRLSSSMLAKARQPDVESIPASFLPSAKDEEQAMAKALAQLEKVIPFDNGIFQENLGGDAIPSRESQPAMSRAPISHPRTPSIPKDEHRTIGEVSPNAHVMENTAKTPDREVRPSVAAEEASTVSISHQTETGNERPLAKDMVTENQEEELATPEFDHAPEEKKKEDKSMLNDRFSETTPKESLVDRHRSLKGESLRAALTLNQKFMFVNQLFKGNAQDFEHAIDLIEQSSNFHGALERVKAEYADRNGWNLENEEEAEFLEVISRRFK